MQSGAQIARRHTHARKTDMSYTTFLSPLVPTFLSCNMPSQTPEMLASWQGVLREALEQARADGLLSFPKETRDHGMMLYQGLSKPTSSYANAYAFRMLADTLFYMHVVDLSSLGNRLAQDQSLSADQASAAFQEQACALFQSGTFGKHLGHASHLVLSQWNDAQHELFVENWTFHVSRNEYGAAPGMRTTYPIAPVRRPDTLTFSLRLPTGRLLMGASLPHDKLEKDIMPLWQEAKGRHGQMVCSSYVANTYNALMIPVNQRSITVLAHENDVAFVASKDKNDAEIPHTCATHLLDFRMLTVFDESLLERVLRETWNEEDSVSKSRMADIFAKTAHTHTRLNVAPGTYTFTLPTTYDNTLAGKHARGKLGQAHHLIAHLRRHEK